MATEPDQPAGHCPECGGHVTRGRAGCQALFDEVIAREFSDFRYAREHRLTVDAYSLQHPDEYMRSAKSYAAHLTGAYVAIELGSAAENNRAIQQWLSRSTALDRPRQPEPAQRGALTILHVHAATDPDDHLRRVREWAKSAWAAWHAFHPIAQRWTDEALGRKGA